MKMRELFPEAFQVKGNESFEVQNISWFSYGDEYQSTAEQDSAIEYAVMNHGRLEQENAELREAVQDLLDCKGILTSDKECVIKAKQLLRK